MLKEKYEKPKEEEKDNINTEKKEENVDSGGWEQYELNPMIEIYKAVKRTLSKLKKDENDPNSPPLFPTIRIDTGQFNRIVKEENSEIDFPLPAVFIHFINIRYLVQQQRIGEGRANMRIRFITNVLNGEYEELELEGFRLFQRINMAIQEAKGYEEALNERCNLTYFDTCETANMLQAYWIDYEMWFRDWSAWQYKKYKPVYLVTPPFTNHSDQDNPPTSHGNHTRPVYNEASEFYPKLEGVVDPEIPNEKPSVPAGKEEKDKEWDAKTEEPSNIPSKPKN